MIRPYQNDDKSTVISIWREASGLAHPFLSSAQMDEAASMIREHFLDIAETYIAEHDGAPVGFIALIGTEVGGLFLRPAFHGRGIGKALMDNAVARCGAVQLEVFTDNAIGRKFYKSYGFVEGAEKVDPHFGLMTKELSYTPT